MCFGSKNSKGRHGHLKLGTAGIGVLHGVNAKLIISPVAPAYRNMLVFIVAGPGGDVSIPDNILAGAGRCTT